MLRVIRTGQFLGGNCLWERLRCLGVKSDGLGCVGCIWQEICEFAGERCQYFDIGNMSRYAEVEYIEDLMMRQKVAVNDVIEME